MEQHDVNPKVRLLTCQVETGFGIQAVIAFQGAGEGQFGHTTSF